MGNSSSAPQGAAPAQTTNWTAWSTCAATGCGTNAVKSRTRVVSGSGKRDTVGCGWTEPTCWSDWGPCGGACGTTAFRTRSRSGAPSPLAPDGLNDESEQCDYQMPSCNLLVSCNNGNQEVVMNTKVLASYVSFDVSTMPGWALVGDYYEATWSSFTDETFTLAEVDKFATAGDASTQYKALSITKTLDTEGCTQATVDGVSLCVGTGFNLSFECTYSLETQNLDSTMSVSGSDFTDQVDGTGTLSYTLALDSSSMSIGDVVTATITPVTANLVHASIKDCHVSHDHDGISTNEDQSINLIDAGLSPVCPLTANVITGKGTGPLSFSWQSFKWSTTKTTNGDDVAEDQTLKCSISLSLEEQGQTEAWTDRCDIICTGADLSTVADVADLDACKKLCEDNTDCKAIRYADTHYLDKKSCMLMSGCPTELPNIVNSYGITSFLNTPAL